MFENLSANSKTAEIDLVTGRYIQSDQIGFDGGIHTYLYENANSLRFVDELGLRGMCINNNIHLMSIYGPPPPKPSDLMNFIYGKIENKIESEGLLL